eukprot:2789683-Rhodomonas_salina.1
MGRPAAAASSRVMTGAAAVRSSSFTHRVAYTHLEAFRPDTGKPSPVLAEAWTGGRVRETMTGIEKDSVRQSGSSVRCLSGVKLRPKVCETVACLEGEENVRGRREELGGGERKAVEENGRHHQRKGAAAKTLPRAQSSSSSSSSPPPPLPSSSPSCSSSEAAQRAESSPARSNTGAHTNAARSDASTAARSEAGPEELALCFKPVSNADLALPSLKRLLLQVCASPPPPPPHALLRTFPRRFPPSTVADMPLMMMTTLLFMEAVLPFTLTVPPFWEASAL